ILIEVAFLLTAWACAPEERNLGREPSRAPGAIRGSSTEVGGETQSSSQRDLKVCSCVKIDTWRDSVVVPDPWPLSACTSYCRNVLLGDSAEAFCFSATGFVQGPSASVNLEPLLPPEGNTCGW